MTERSFRHLLHRLAGSSTRTSPRRRGFALAQFPYRPVLERLEGRTLPTVALTGVPNWVPEGPAPITSNASIGPTLATSFNVGAINAVAVDPANAKHLFAATVNGGIWQTSDFTVATPSWSTTTDLMPSLAIESIAFSPVNSNVIYAGTGSYSSIFLRTFGGEVNIGGQGGAAVGVYKSTDGGATWQTQNPSGIFSGLRIIRIIPTSLNGGQTVFAATTDGGGSGGVFRTDDGGATWTRLSGANGLPNSGVTDLVINPANTDQFFAATSNTIAGAGAGIYLLDVAVSNTNWVNVTNNMAAADVSASDRIELSISPAGANPIWASIINATRRNGMDQVTTQGQFYQRVYRGVAGGGTVNWTQVGPLSGAVRQPPDVLAGNQGDVHGAIVADPSADNLVYISGDRVSNGGFGTNRGYVARGDSTANTWTAITPNGSGGGSGDPGTAVPASNSVTTSPHADSRGMVFASGGVLVYSCDGGVYQCTNPSSTTSGAQTWTSINGTIQDTEFYNVAYDDRFHIIFGGSQDNGTPSQNAQNSVNSYNDQTGGDGGATAVDNFSRSGAGESVHYFFGVTRKWFDGANHRPAGDNDAFILPKAGLAGLTGSSANDLFAFSTVNSVAGRIVVAGGTSMTKPVGALYESSDAGSASETLMGTSYFVNDNWTQIPTDDGSVTGLPFVRASALAYGGMLSGVPNPDVLWAASGSDMYLRTTAGGTLTATSGQPLVIGTIVAIAVDPTNWHTAVITDATSVYMTTDAGAHWTNITGDLTNPPGSRGAPASLAVIAGSGVDAVLFGGTKGVFRMLTNTPNLWTRFGANQPNAFSGGIVYDGTDDVLVNATYGRGAWAIANASTTAFTPGSLSITADNTVDLRIDPNNTDNLDVYENKGLVTGSTPPPDFIYPRALFQQISVTTTGANAELFLDFSNGNFIPANGGISYDAGAGANTKLDLLGQLPTGFFLNETETPTSSTGGTIVFDTNPAITYTEVGTVDDTTTIMGTASYTATSAAELIHIVNGGTVNGLQATQVDSSTSATFATVDFANKPTATVDGVDGADTVTVNNPNPGVNLATLNVITGPTAGATVKVLATPATVTTDAVGNASATVQVGNAGSAQGIHGPLNVENPPSSTAATVDDSADATGRTATLSIFAPNSQDSETNGDPYLKVQGLAPGDINLEVANSAGLTLKGGTGMNTLNGPNLDDKWNITGLNQGNLSDGGGVSFTSFQNVGGGTGQDVFRFLAAGRLNGIINGNGGGDFLNYSSKTGPVTVNLTTGTASYTGGVQHIQNVIGSANGGDILKGNALGNILVSHGSGNTLTAGSGRSLLIAGFGKNLLRGSTADDIEIAGSTGFDSNIAALTGILAEWQSANTYSVRISHLKNGGGLNGTSRLIVNSTVFLPNTPPGPRFGSGGGSQQSTLIGGGGLNWFFTLFPSTIVDLQQGIEQVN
jgi:hypothetical protein